MIGDSQLNQLIPLGSPLSLVAAAGVAIPSVGTIDLLGQGVGTAPQGIIGNVTPWGAPDPGIGGMRPQMDIAIGTAAVTANSATLNLAWQYAADQGSAGNYQPSTWYTALETGPIAAALLVAGALIARFDWMPVPVGVTRVRYARLLAQVPAATNFTAGTIAFAFMTLVRDDLANRFGAKNFTV